MIILTSDIKMSLFLQNSHTAVFFSLVESAKTIPLLDVSLHSKSTSDVSSVYSVALMQVCVYGKQNMHEFMNK